MAFNTVASACRLPKLRQLEHTLKPYTLVLLHETLNLLAGIRQHIRTRAITETKISIFTAPHYGQVISYYRLLYPPKHHFFANFAHFYTDSEVPFIPPSPSTFLPRRESTPPALPQSPPDVQAGLSEDPNGVLASTPRRRRPVDPRRWWWNPHPNAFAPGFMPPPRLSLHNQLVYNPINTWMPPQILWDLVFPASYARVQDPRFPRCWKDPDFDAPAIVPSVKKIWILSDHSVLGYWINRWGPIVVKSANMTIRDVLEGIYTYLRVPLTNEDLTESARVPGNRKRLRYARAQRAKESHELEAVVLSHGYRRIDVVGGHRRFHGMRIVVLPDRTWRLDFNLMPGPVPRII